MAAQYAVVAYVRNALGHFVEELRRDLYPEHGHLPAHITVLPPRPLCGSEDEALEGIRRALPLFGPFPAELGDVENFMPATPTVFLRVARSAYRFRELHDALNTGALHCEENWPYMPHLTIVKMPATAEAERADAISRTRWQGFHGKRGFTVRELTFVREGEANHWIDLATLQLGGLPTLSHSTL